MRTDFHLLVQKSMECVLTFTQLRQLVLRHLDVTGEEFTKVRSRVKIGEKDEEVATNFHSTQQGHARRILHLQVTSRVKIDMEKMRKSLLTVTQLQNRY